MTELEKILNNKVAAIKVQLLFLSLSLSLTHTHTHTHTLFLSLPLPPPSTSLSPPPPIIGNESLPSPQALQQQVRQLESQVAELRHKLSLSEAAREKFATKASELEQEAAGLRVANSLLEQQVDSLQGEVGVAELVQQDLNHLLKVVEDGVGSGEMKVSE